MSTPTLAPRARAGAPAAAPAAAGRERWRDGALLAVAAVLLRLPAYLAPAHLSFDDGVYGASAVAMRHGGVPFREVFSSQGPLWLPLVRLGDLLTLRTLDSPRTVAVVSGAVLAVAVYVAAREIGGRAGALLAAGLVVVSGSALWTTGPLTSDGAGEALAATAVAAALVYRRRRGAGPAVAAGALAGAAFAVKSLLVLPAVLVAAAVVVAHAPRRHVAAAAGAAAIVMVAATVPWGVGNVYQQSVAYHTGVSYDRTPGANARKTISTLTDRDPTVVAAGLVAAAGAVGLALSRRRRPAKADPADAPPAATAGPAGPLGRLVSGRMPAVAWTVLTVAVLALEAPLWRNHVVHLVPPLALLIAASGVPWPALLAAAVLAAPWQVAGARGVLRPHPYRGAAAVVTGELRRLPDGALAISDDPGLVWRSGLATPPDLVDTSVLRITSTDPRVNLTVDDLETAASDPRVCAVVQWSADRFGRFGDLGGRIEEQGYRRAEPDLGGDRRLWLRRPCRPGAPRAGGDVPSGRGTAAVEPSRSPG